MAPDTTGDLGSILSVWAHPDDEAYLASGVMARAIDAGRMVTCVTATYGEGGFPADDDRSIETRVALRCDEMALCLTALGVTDHRWLRYSDGGCADVPDDEGSDAIARIIAEVQPDTVLTFGPDGATGHPDHMAVSRWTTVACARAGARGSAPRLLYATKTHDWNRTFFSIVDPTDVLMIEGMQPESVDPAELAIWFRCDDDMLSRKMQALLSHKSQVGPLVTAYGHDALADLVRDECFRAPRGSDAHWRAS